MHSQQSHICIQSEGLRLTLSVLKGGVPGECKATRVGTQVAAERRRLHDLEQQLRDAAADCQRREGALAARRAKTDAMHSRLLSEVRAAYAAIGGLSHWKMERL